MKKRLLALMVGAAMVFSLAACGGGSGDTGNKETKPAETQGGAETAAPAAEAGGEGGTIKLGVLFPYTGSAAAVAEDAQKGIEFAIDEINSRGGIASMGGAKIELVYGDTQSNPYGECIE